MPESLLTLSRLMPHMPPESWWLAPVVLFLLGVLAVIDAVKSQVPDPLVLPSLMMITMVQGYYMDWVQAGKNLAMAFAVAFVIFLANELWFRILKRDALGMGDAKWTMLAVATFGLLPSAIAWGVGASLAIVCLGLMRLGGRKFERVHFAPFLFVGLIVGIYIAKVKLGA